MVKAQPTDMEGRWCGLAPIWPCRGAGLSPSSNPLGGASDIFRMTEDLKTLGGKGIHCFIFLTVFLFCLLSKPDSV